MERHKIIWYLKIHLFFHTHIFVLFFFCNADADIFKINLDLKTQIICVCYLAALHVCCKYANKPTTSKINCLLEWSWKKELTSSICRIVPEIKRNLLLLKNVIAFKCQDVNKIILCHSQTLYIQHIICLSNLYKINKYHAARLFFMISNTHTRTPNYTFYFSIASSPALNVCLCFSAWT